MELNFLSESIILSQLIFVFVEVVSCLKIVAYLKTISKKIKYTVANTQYKKLGFNRLFKGCGSHQMSCNLIRNRSVIPNVSYTQPLYTMLAHSANIRT